MKKVFKFLFIILIVLGFCIISLELRINYNYKNEESKRVEEYLNLDSSYTNDYYVSVLEIPKLGLKKGLVSPNSKYNNVNQNIENISHTMPGDDIFVLAAHSGNSRVSFFKNLNSLKTGDIIYAYYKDIKYVYKVYTYYESVKNGKLVLNNFSTDKEIMVLTTCKPFSFNKQLVYIATLENKISF